MDVVACLSVRTHDADGPGVVRGVRTQEFARGAHQVVFPYFREITHKVHHFFDFFVKFSIFESIEHQK